MNRDYIEVYSGEDGKWYWRRCSANNEVISQGQGYTRMRDALRGAVRANPDSAPRAFRVNSE